MSRIASRATVRTFPPWARREWKQFLEAWERYFEAVFWCGSGIPADNATMRSLGVDLGDVKSSAASDMEKLAFGWLRALVKDHEMLEFLRDRDSED